MRVRFRIEKKPALLAGKDKSGYVVVDVPPAILTETQRIFLAKAAAYKLSNDRGPDADYYIDHWQIDSQDQHYADVLDNLSGVADAIEARHVLDRLIEADRRRAAEAEEKKRREHEERVAEALKAGPEFFTGPYSGHDPRLAFKDRGLGEEPRVKDLIGQAKQLVEAYSLAQEALKEEEARKKEVLEQRKLVENAKKDAERAVWIAAHGSDRLKRMLAEGIECSKTYLDERLEVERPGWTWWAETDGTEYQADNPPAKAFAMLDECRKVDPEARLILCEDQHECDEGCYGCGDCPEFDFRGHIVMAEFMDRDIVYGAPEGLAKLKKLEADKASK